MEILKRKWSLTWIVGGLCVLTLVVPGHSFAQNYGEDAYGSGEYGGTETDSGNGDGGGESSRLRQDTQTAETAETTKLTDRIALLQRMVELLNQLQSLQKQQGLTPSVPPDFFFTNDIELGSVGEDVRRLQQFLNTHGYSLAAAVGEAGSPGNETTYFGVLTRDALARFQTANSITPAVGYFGPITRSVVNSLLN